MSSNLLQVNRLAGVGIVGRLWLALLVLPSPIRVSGCLFQPGRDAGALLLVALALGGQLRLKLGLWDCGQLLGAAGEVVADARTSAKVGALVTGRSHLDAGCAD
jgi:hypothetical protein